MLQILERGFQCLRLTDVRIRVVLRDHLNQSSPEQRVIIRNMKLVHNV